MPQRSTLSIATTAGKTYVLTFDVGADPGSGLYTGPVGVTATAGATSKIFSGINPTAVCWRSLLGTGNSVRPPPA